MPVAIRFVAVIGPANSPLYLKSFKETEPQMDLRYHFIAHMALDYILSEPAYTETTREYALLLVHDDIAVYGSSTNTNVKIFVGVDARENMPFDLISVIGAVQAAYISHMCNPFRQADETAIQSKAFDRMVDSAVSSWNDGEKAR